MRSLLKNSSPKQISTPANANTLISGIALEYGWWAQERQERQLPANVLGQKLRGLGFKGGFANVTEDGQRRTCRVVHARLVGPRAAY